jgi:hypothetical protein
MRLSLSASVLVSSLVLAGALVWFAESQRYAISGDGGMTVRLDRRTGETAVCVTQQHDSHFSAPCTGERQ